MRRILVLTALLMLSEIALAIPAAPVMTLYQFNGDLNIPFYDVAAFQRKGASAPAGFLPQGTTIIPCLVISNSLPLTDSEGTPYVGYRVVTDARKADRGSAARLREERAKRETMEVRNHHCEVGITQVLNVRKTFNSGKVPFFDPPAQGNKDDADSSQDDVDRIVRSFHNSPRCAAANSDLVGRRQALEQAWNSFTRDNRERWPRPVIDQARAIDYVMRTTIFEGHLGRGCSAYGACERNVIALSIRNRARGACSQHQGCRSEGDFEGVASKVSQYNIWDEYLTQISGLTSCFLRDDLGQKSESDGGDDNAAHYRKLQRMYKQSYADVKRILHGDNKDLQQLFPGVALGDLKGLRHYYHPPAMGKCFPNHKRAEYMSGAIAAKGGDFALIANTRIHVDEAVPGGYRFREFTVTLEDDRDNIDIVDRYPGFVIDKRKVSLKPSSRCYPYGIPRACRFDKVERYRKVPSWLKAGKALELTCRVRQQGDSCDAEAVAETVKVGGKCDIEMKPVSGVR